MLGASLHEGIARHAHQDSGARVIVLAVAAAAVFVVGIGVGTAGAQAPGVYMATLTVIDVHGRSFSATTTVVAR